MSDSTRGFVLMLSTFTITVLWMASRVWLAMSWFVSHAQFDR